MSIVCIQNKQRLNWRKRIVFGVRIFAILEKNTIESANMEMVMAEEMETSKSGSRSDSLVFVKPDTNRMLKRSINTLAIDGKLNGE